MGWLLYHLERFRRRHHHSLYIGQYQFFWETGIRTEQRTFRRTLRRKRHRCRLHKFIGTIDSQRKWISPNWHSVRIGWTVLCWNPIGTTDEVISVRTQGVDDTR